jgi:hypothetical protein
MRAERRGRIVRVCLAVNRGAGMSRTSGPKSYQISKHLVFEAYLRVKANKGAAGVDGESIRYG